MTMLNSDKNPVEKSTGFFCACRRQLCDLQVVLLYTMNRKRKDSQKKLSHLHTCEMEKYIVEYLAVYDCIQLFNYYGYDGGQHETVQRNE